MEAKSLVVINTVHRRPAGGTPYLHKPAGRLTVGGGTPLPRNRPFNVTLAFVQAHLEELKEKVKTGLIEVRERSVNGPIFDLETLSSEKPAVEIEEEKSEAPEPAPVEVEPDQEEKEEVPAPSESDSGGDTLDDDNEDFFADDEPDYENMTKKELINILLEKDPEADERILSRMNKRMLLERLS